MGPPPLDAVVQNLCRGGLGFAFGREGCLGLITNLTELAKRPTEAPKAQEVRFDLDCEAVVFEHFAES